jgi:hypothetical protein
MTDELAAPKHAQPHTADGRSIGQLVRALESTWLEPDTVDLDRLTAMLGERQTLLTRIQESDTSTLDPATKRELFERLGRIRRRDQRLLAALAERRTELGKDISGVLHARNAVRGYRPIDSEPPRGRGRLV